MSPDTFTRWAALLPEATLLVDGNAGVLSANKAVGRLLGCAASGLVGRSLTDLTTDGAAAVTELLRAGSRSPEFVPGALQFSRGEAQPLDVRCEVALVEPRAADRPALIAMRLFDRSVRVNRFLLLSQRIDELARENKRRRAAEAQAQDYGERLRVTLGSIGDAVIATDARGLVTLMNPVAEQLTGWSAAEADQQPLHDIFKVVDRHSGEPVDDPVGKVLRGGAIVGVSEQVVLVARDGRRCAIDDSAAPIRDAQGRLMGIVLVFRDFSERLALEQELRERGDRLLQAAQRNDQFLAMLAHELRNPLAPMVSGVDLLLRSGAVDAARQAKIASMMRRQLSHLSRLIDDLLDVARLTHGKIALHREPVALSAVLEQALEVVSSAAEQRGVQWHIGRVDRELCLDADAVRLVQVFGNLLGNAVKFSRQGGAVDVQVRRAGDGVDVVIRDAGAGMEPELLARIFDLFVQADPSLDRPEGGLGVGLTIVRTIVDLHGGRVEARSEGRGRGTEVTVWLPLGVTVPQPPVADEQREEKGPSGAAAAADRLRVLVVDDNVDAADALREIVEDWGYQARSVQDGPAAIAVDGEWPADVALLDIGLPGISGFELARRLRKGAPDRKLLLIAVTGYGSPADRAASQEAGFDEHLTKPADLDRLERLLATHARLPRMHA